MERIRQVAFALAGVALVALLIVGGAYAFHLATYQPSLYIRPPQVQDPSNIKTVREATSLEGLRTVCTMWAESEDRSHAFLKMQMRVFENMLQNIALFLGGFGAIFLVGLTYIYVLARRLGRAPNAL